MKDFYKKPIFYYISGPFLLALWPLLLWLVYLPAVRRDWAHEQYKYVYSQRIIEEILAIDSERLRLTNPKTGSAQFDYATAVEKIASSCKIPAASYKLSSGMVIVSAGQKTQSARVSLKDVSMAQIANFLSAIQLRWPDLQCTQSKLSKRKELPDAWDADFDFKYFY
jgi:hypothetical protein